MYVSDQRTSNFFAIFALVIGPWLGVSREAWGWMLDVLLLFSVFWVGRNKRENGLRTAIISLTLGYVLSLTFNGFASMGSMSFVPWAAVITLWAIKMNLPRSVIVFWSLCLAGLAGAIPGMVFLHQGIPQESVQAIIQGIFEQYRQSGMLSTFQQQGMSESELKSLLEQIINYVILITPGLATISGLLKWGTVYYFFTRWFTEPGQEYRYFILWRIPWYAVWGMNLAVLSYLIGDQFQWVVLKGFGINLMLVYGIVALILGSSVFLFYLKSPRMSVFLKTILVFTSLIYIHITIVGLILLGLFDLVLNFRRLPGPEKG